MGKKGWWRERRQRSRPRLEVLTQNNPCKSTDIAVFHVHALNGFKEVFACKCQTGNSDLGFLVVFFFFFHRFDPDLSVFMYT